MKGWEGGENGGRKEGVTNNCYGGMEEGGREGHLVSEGRGAVVKQKESNGEAKDVEYGGQTGKGLWRL